MKKELRIPTLIAIFILLLGLFVTSFLTGQAQRFFAKADIMTKPKNIKVTNITDTSFSVSWTTDQETIGTISYSDAKGSAKPVQDDRVQAGQSNDKFLTHHATIRFLKPGSSFTYKIISGNQEYTDPSYKVITAPTANNSTVSTPVYGTVLKSDQTPAVGALVYVSVKDSSVLSTITKSNGNWLVTLNNTRTKDLSRPMNFNARGDAEDIFIQADKDNVATVKTITGNDAPVPTVVLGKDYDFSKEKSASEENKAHAEFTPTPTIGNIGGANSVSTPTPTVLLSQINSPTPTPTLVATDKTNFTQPPADSTEPEILIPNKNSTISDSKPAIQGVGVPGQVVQIILHSDQNLAASVVVGSDGRWSWTPPENLTPGEHTIMIATADQSGKVKTVTQNFTVLASGTSVAESATPSATMTPTFTPTPTATSAPLPKTGSIELTSLLFFAGMSILVLGAIVFYASTF